MGVSIRCRVRRTAERRRRGGWQLSVGMFLFAVVRDVQRNRACSPSSRAGSSFYSLSCETYSGTFVPDGVDDEEWAEFLFAVVRDVQRNGMAALFAELRPRLFLFAVVRDVQRNS